MPLSDEEKKNLGRTARQVERDVINENNKLRKNNEKLTKENDRLNGQVARLQAELTQVRNTNASYERLLEQYEDGVKIGVTSPEGMPHEYGLCTDNGCAPCQSWRLNQYAKSNKIWKAQVEVLKALVHTAAIEKLTDTQKINHLERTLSAYRIELDKHTIKGEPISVSIKVKDP